LVARPNHGRRLAQQTIVVFPFFLARPQWKESAMPYVDGFVVAVPKQNLEAYKTRARKVGEVWKETSATAYVEYIGDDVPYGKLTSFPRAVQAKNDEGSSPSRAHSATRSAPKSWRIRGSKPK
jgi:Protein of unknown function (DUF1428)